MEGQRQAALAVLQASIDHAMAEIQIYKTELEAKVEAKRFEYVGLDTRLKQLDRKSTRLNSSH